MGFGEGTECLPTPSIHANRTGLPIIVIICVASPGGGRKALRPPSSVLEDDAQAGTSDADSLKLTKSTFHDDFGKSTYGCST